MVLRDGHEKTSNIEVIGGGTWTRTKDTACIRRML